MEINNSTAFHHAENMMSKEERQRTRNRLAQQKKLARVNCENSRVHQAEEAHLPRPATTQITSQFPSWDGDDMHMLNHFEPDPMLVLDFADTDVDTNVRSHTPENPSALADFRPSNMAIVSSLVESRRDVDWRTPAGTGHIQPIRSPEDCKSTHTSLEKSKARPGHSLHQSDKLLLIEETDNNVKCLLRPGSRSSEGYHNQYQRHSHHRLPSGVVQEGRQQSHTESHHPPPINDRHMTHRRCFSPTTDSGTPGLTTRDKRSPEGESIESRLERILHVVEENGFDSIDSMTSAYYNSKFSESSTMGPIQFASRSRRLRSLLSTLQESHVEWSTREVRAYRDEVSHMAEKLYSGELGKLISSHEAHYPDKSRASVLSRSSPESLEGSLDTSRWEIAHRIRELLSQPDIASFIQKDAATLQDSASDTWSLLTELARKAGMQPDTRARAASAILYLLTSPLATRW